MLQGIHDIDSLSNQRVKDARALREKKHRREAGKFLAEGLRIRWHRRWPRRRKAQAAT
jgi:hypothetical protein